jgi:hypothetical protein
MNSPRTCRSAVPQMNPIAYCAISPDGVSPPWAYPCRSANNATAAYTPPIGNRVANSPPMPSAITEIAIPISTGAKGTPRRPRSHPIGIVPTKQAGTSQKCRPPRTAEPKPSPRSDQVRGQDATRRRRKTSSAAPYPDQCAQARVISKPKRQKRLQ